MAAVSKGPRHLRGTPFVMVGARCCSPRTLPSTSTWVDSIGTLDDAITAALSSEQPRAQIASIQCRHPSSRMSATTKGVQAMTTEPTAEEVLP